MAITLTTTRTLHLVDIENLVGDPRAAAATVRDVLETRLAGPPAVPVAHHADVPGNGVGRQGSLEPAFVQPVDQVTKIHAGGLPHRRLTYGKRTQRVERSG